MLFLIGFPSVEQSGLTGREMRLFLFQQGKFCLSGAVIAGVVDENGTSAVCIPVPNREEERHTVLKLKLDEIVGLDFGADGRLYRCQLFTGKAKNQQKFIHQDIKLRQRVESKKDLVLLFDPVGGTAKCLEGDFSGKDIFQNTLGVCA